MEEKDLLVVAAGRGMGPRKQPILPDEAHHEEDRKWAVGYRKVSKAAKRISPAQWHAVSCIWEGALWDFSDQVHAIIPHQLVWWEMDQNFEVELDGLSPAGVPIIRRSHCHA